MSKRVTSRSNWNLEVLVFVGDGKPKKIKLSEQGENQQQTQPNRDAKYGNRTRVIEVGGKRLSTAPPVLSNAFMCGG